VKLAGWKESPHLAPLYWLAMLHTAADAASATELAYQVDDLLVDVVRAQVWRAGEILPLPRLSFDLLLVLIEAAPRIVSPDELMDKVWATVVVNPETVSQRVKLLRDALGDDPRTPRYVAGVRGRGYRLVPDVGALRTTAPSKAQPEERPAAAAAVVEAISPAPPRSRWWTLAAVVAGIALVLVAAMFLARRAGDDQSRAGTDTALLASPRSVAVLPFESLGDAGQEDVLAFGIAEAVLHRLANLRELEVIARTSSFSLPGKPRDVREIGRALKVRYLLEGSVQHDGDRLRVTAQLVDAANGAHLWSVQFDRKRADVFAMQDEIATQVAKALQLSLDANAAGRLDERSTKDFDAYLAYLQGRALLATGRLVDAGSAVKHFRSALRLDPTFAAAYVSLAEADVFAMEFDATDDRTARFDAAGRRAVVLLTRALQLDPDYGPAYLMRGYLEAFSDLDLPRRVTGADSNCGPAMPGVTPGWPPSCSNGRPSVRKRSKCSNTHAGWTRWNRDTT
jgi:TolB-like protein/DNA-binding winged helix-turn-helix (wHTH) protein